MFYVAKKNIYCNAHNALFEVSKRYVIEDTFVFCIYYDDALAYTVSVF